jgi:branched-chain amino acid aminotransferase
MYVYVKNNFVNQNEAFAPISDRGFRYGDGVFETIRIFNRVPYRFDFHLNRLMVGLESIKISYDNYVEIYRLSKEIINKNNIVDGFLRVYVTRGEGSLGYLPVSCKPNLYIEAYPINEDEIQKLEQTRIRLHISKWESIPHNSIPKNSKLAQGINPTLARIEAIEHGCFESIMLNHEKYVAECSSSNIFLCKGDNIFTPSLSSGAMNGSIRDAILSLIQGYFNIYESQITLTDLMLADGVFITNVSWLLLPVYEIPALAVTYGNVSRIKEIKQLLLNDIYQHMGSLV